MNKYKGELQFKGYYDSFLESLYDVSNEKQQNKEWKLGIHNPRIVFSFGEVYQEFIGFSEAIFSLYKDVNISESQIEKVKILYEMLKKYYETQLIKIDAQGNQVRKTEYEIATDPKWHEVRDYAKLVYQELTKDGV